MRRLSLMPAEAAMQPIEGRTAADEPVVATSTNLRTALGVLLDSGAPRLIVVDDDARPVGTLTLKAIQRLTVATSPEETEVVETEPIARRA